MISDFRSAWVAIVGLPNAGKSTLLNQLIGKDLAIISSKPQTTRNQILGIRHTDTCQLLFLDTPGFYQGKMKIDAFFRQEIDRSLSEADMILYILDGKRPSLEKNKAFLDIVCANAKVPVVLVVNKLDILRDHHLIPLLSQLPELFPQVKEIIPVSAKSRRNLDKLTEIMEALVPEGPQFYPEEQFTDRGPQFLLAEFVREGLFRKTEEEVPFSIGVSVTELVETETKIVAGVTIFVEKEGQKGIVIGEDGELLNWVRKHTSMRARRFFNKKVELSLWVKVKPGWRQNDGVLKQVGLK